MIDLGLTAMKTTAFLPHDLLQRLRLTAQLLHIVRRRRAGRITGQPALAGVEEILRPAVIHRQGDPLAPAQLGDALLAPHAFQYDADLLFGRELPLRRSGDVLHDLLCRRFLRPGFPSHCNRPVLTALRDGRRFPNGVTLSLAFKVMAMVRAEVLGAIERRRRWRYQDKVRIVEESFAAA